MPITLVPMPGEKSDTDSAAGSSGPPSTAQQNSSSLATFDEGLRATANRMIDRELQESERVTRAALISTSVVGGLGATAGLVVLGVKASQHSL